jgi:hypothetical protein
MMPLEKGVRLEGVYRMIGNWSSGHMAAYTPLPSSVNEFTFTFAEKQ